MGTIKLFSLTNSILLSPKVTGVVSHLIQESGKPAGPLIPASPIGLRPSNKAVLRNM